MSDDLLKRADDYPYLTQPHEVEQLVRDLSAALKVERLNREWAEGAEKLLAQRAERAEADAIKHATAESIARMERDALVVLLRGVRDTCGHAMSETEKARIDAALAKNTRST